MTVVALGSAKGAPGVTTMALALAAGWPANRALMVVEADPDGGVLAARRDLSPEPGLVTLAAALRRDRGTLTPHRQALGEGVHALCAPVAAAQVRAALAVGGDGLSSALAAAQDDVLIDCGRLTVTSPAAALARDADTVLILLRPRLDEVLVVRERVAALRADGVEVALLLLRDGPYPAGEVAEATDAPVAAEVPLDRRAAEALGHAGVRLSPRSPLLRSARHIAATLVARPPGRPVGTP